MPRLIALRPRWPAAAALALLCALALGGGGLQRAVAADERARAALAAMDEVCIVAPPSPYDPALGLPLLAPRAVPADARCPVCGMYPARSPQWAAQVIFRDGDAHFFDSPLSLFIYLGRVGFYSRGRLAQDVAAAYVKDAESGQWIAALDAAYVAGSSALGPMRAGNYPAFQSPQAAGRFAQARGGEVIAAGELARRLVPAAGPQPHAH